MSYDIFISYRRLGGREYARLIQQALRAHGYNVFFDFESVEDGVFKDSIFRAIEEAPIFLLILSKGSMQNCVDADDWVRTEINHALRVKTAKIVPVNIGNEFDGFPKQLCMHPGHLGSVIQSIQYAKLDMENLFDESIDKLIRTRIAPVVTPRKKILSKVIYSILAVAVLVASIYLFKSNASSDSSPAIEELPTVAVDSAYVEPKEVIKQEPKADATPPSNNGGSQSTVTEATKVVEEQPTVIEEFKPNIVERPVEFRTDEELLSYGLAEYKSYRYTSALPALKTVADKGNAVAGFYVGIMYLEGNGTIKSGSTAFLYMLDAAKGGDAKAIFQVAEMYERGVGVTKDKNQARYWYEKSVSLGNETASARLSRM